MNKELKTCLVNEAKYGRGNSTGGVDEEKSYAESYGERFAPSSPYVAASPYARDLGRTSASVEALRVQALLNAPRRSTLTAFMSDGSVDII